jgi:hypothetical protein
MREFRPVPKPEPKAKAKPNTMKNIQTLHLTLKQPWFNLMLTGEKTKEYRDPSKWIMSRLFWEQNLYFPKKFDKIRFANGYGAHRPWFEVEFLGVNKAILKETLHYTTGDTLELYGEFLVIRLGKVLDSGNLDIIKTIN